MISMSKCLECIFIQVKFNLQQKQDFFTCYGLQVLFPYLTFCIESVNSRKSADCPKYLCAMTLHVQLSWMGHLVVAMQALKRPTGEQRLCEAAPCIPSGTIAVVIVSRIGTSRICFLSFRCIVVTAQSHGSAALQLLPFCMISRL